MRNFIIFFNYSACSTDAVLRMKNEIHRVRLNFIINSITTSAVCAERPSYICLLKFQQIWKQEFEIRILGPVEYIYCSIREAV
jgi:hypothetical protein